MRDKAPAKIVGFENRTGVYTKYMRSGMRRNLLFAASHSRSGGAILEFPVCTFCVKVPCISRGTYFFMNSPIAFQKADLRKQMLSARMNMPAATQAIAAQAVARHFADHPILAFAPSFAVYAAMRGEVNTFPLAQHMRDYRKTICLPRIDGEALSFHIWNEDDALEQHGFGHAEPRAHAEEFTPAIVLVPLVAFDHHGHRLGYGGGYYDRTMQQMRARENPPLFVGVAYALQEVDHLPHEPHDQHLDGILTEQGVSMFSCQAHHPLP